MKRSWQAVRMKDTDVIPFTICAMRAWSWFDVVRDVPKYAELYEKAKKLAEDQ